MRGKSAWCKFLWQECPEGIDDVVILVSEEFVDKVVEVNLRGKWCSGKSAWR